MAITAKPTSYSVDTGNALCPTHLYMLDEGTGTTAVDRGTGTGLNMTLQNSAMWGTDGSLGSIITCSSASSYYALSATGTIWDISSAVMMVAIMKSASAVAPTLAEYVCGYGKSNVTTPGYGGARINASATVLQGIASDGTNVPTNGDATTVYDNSWHMVAVKIHPDTAAIVVETSVDGETWDQAPTGTLLSSGYTVDRYGIGCRPAATPSNAFNGDVLAFFVYENDYASWDNTFIASLYSDPWQFLTTGADIQFFQYQWPHQRLARL